MKTRTQEKIELVEEIVVASFTDTNSIDGACLAITNIDGIGFSEILPLVKFIGEKHGFIVPMTRRKENAIEYIGETYVQDFMVTYNDIMEYVAEIVRVNGTAPKWTLGEVKKYAMMDNEDILIPRKPTHPQWMDELVDCFIENPAITPEEATECVAEFKKETKVPVSMLPMLQRLHRALTA